MTTRRSLNLADLMGPGTSACDEGSAAAVLMLRSLRLVTVPDRRFWYIAKRVAAQRATRRQLDEYKEMAREVEITLDVEKLVSAKIKGGDFSSHFVHWAWKCLDPENRELFWEDPGLLEDEEKAQLAQLYRSREDYRRVGGCDCDGCQGLANETDETLEKRARANILSRIPRLRPTNVTGGVRKKVFELLAEQEEWEEEG